jgi:hypothetical protein
MFSQLDASGLFISSGFHSIEVPDSTGNHESLSSFAGGFGAKGFFRKKNNEGQSKGGLPGFILDFTFSDYSYISAGLTYNLLRGRVQIPIGIMTSFGSKEFEKDKDEVTVVSLLGSAGIQYYLNNTLWISLEGRYRVGKYTRTIDEVGNKFDREYSNNFSSYDIMLRLGYTIF